MEQENKQRKPVRKSPLQSVTYQA